MITEKNRTAKAPSATAGQSNTSRQMIVGKTQTHQPAIGPLSQQVSRLSPSTQQISQVPSGSALATAGLRVPKSAALAAGQSNTSRNMTTGTGETQTSNPPQAGPLSQRVSLSAQRISQALKAQRCPTNKEISSFCKCTTT